jgi:DNA (cytosine-5)-methyltransferase 1
MKKNITSTKPADLSSNTGIDWYGQSWVEKTFSHPENVVRVGTAFSGIGSPEMALEQLGVKHEVVFACDINKSAKKSYLANYPVKDWWDDVKALDAKKYKGNIDLFVAGVCCQPWSLSGKLKGLDDDRGQLFYQFVRVICECAPKVWIFENVDNILRHKTETEDGEEVLSWSILLDDMETEFKEAGLNYHLHWRVLDSADYGIPQHRERVFCIGFLDETGDGKDDFLFPAPIKLEKSVMDYLDDKTPGIRQLTARERIRLMGFPDTFEQVVSDAQFSKQAGNSIVVNVMEALYKQMDITKYGVAA